MVGGALATRSVGLIPTELYSKLATAPILLVIKAAPIHSISESIWCMASHPI